MSGKTAPVFNVSEETERLKNLVSTIIAETKARGMDACEVGASSNVGFSTTVRMGEVETIEFNRDQGFSITVYAGQRKGSASTTDASENTVKTTIEAACNIARYTQEDNCAGLAEPEKMATSLPDLDLYHPWEMNMDEAIAMAKACEQSGRDMSDKIVNSDGATVENYQGCSVYGNSHGFIGSRHATKHSISCMLIAKEAQEMQTDYWYSLSRDPALLESVEEIGQKAAHRTLKKLGSRKIKTGNFPVVFQADVASSLLGHFISAISGGNLYRDASFLKDSLGKQIFPEWVRIYEDPYLLKGLGSGAYDGDGLQTQKKDFVNNGMITSYALGTYFARKLAMDSTANAGGVRNLFIESNAGELQNLLKTMDTGLLVTDFIGSSINMVTGNYSRGASGFWIEKGEIAYPVSEVTVAGNLQDMFNGIVSVGSDIDYRHSLYTGSVLIDKMMIAGE
ncbi:MAG: metalloprotease PmbA [Endozoicomonadaceae bacterium]|nr:metalloprotease PmbA [Endozoicomonadaceae bacterium]